MSAWWLGKPTHEPRMKNMPDRDSATASPPRKNLGLLKKVSMGIFFDTATESPLATDV